MSRFRFPPLARESAIQKVRLAQEQRSRRDAEVVLAHTGDGRWRSRSELSQGFRPDHAAGRKHRRSVCINHRIAPADRTLH